MSRAKGLKRSTPARTAHRLGAHTHSDIAAALQVAPSGGRLLMPCERPDQGPSSTCHAHSSSACCWCAYNAAGKPLPFVPSPLLIASTTYADIRAKEHPVPPLPKLKDDGAELQDDADAMKNWGIAPIKAPTADGRFSDVESGLTDFPEPDTSQLQIAGEDLIDGEYMIPVDSSAPRTVAAALDAGIPVWLGCFVDSAFENLGPSDIAQAPNASDPNGGGHAMFISGYRTNASGKYEFRVENSWGTGWADGGAVWASEEWLMACWDLFPFAVAK